MKIKALLGAGLAFARKHEGTILTICSVTSTIAAVYFAMKDSPKLMAKLDEIKDLDMTNLEKAKAVAPIVARTAVATGISVGCQVANHKFAANTISSLTNAVTMYKTLNEEKDKAIEEVAGKETADEINEKAHEAKAEHSYTLGDIQHAEVTGHGQDLIYDEWGDKWFYSSVNYILTAQNELNKKINLGQDVWVNDLYRALDLKRTGAGSHEGWDNYRLINIEFSGGIDDNNKPYAIMYYANGSQPAHLGRY